MPTKLKRLSVPIQTIHELQLAEFARRWGLQGASAAEVTRCALEELAAVLGIAFRRTEDGYELVQPNS